MPSSSGKRIGKELIVLFGFLVVFLAISKLLLTPIAGDSSQLLGVLNGALFLIMGIAYKVLSHRYRF